MNYLTATVPVDEEDVCSRHLSSSDEEEKNINDTILSQSSMRRNSQKTDQSIRHSRFNRTFQVHDTSLLSRGFN